MKILKHFPRSFPQIAEADTGKAPYVDRVYVMEPSELAIILKFLFLRLRCTLCNHQIIFIHKAS